MRWALSNETNSTAGNRGRQTREISDDTTDLPTRKRSLKELGASTISGCVRSPIPIYRMLNATCRSRCRQALQSAAPFFWRGFRRGKFNRYINQLRFRTFLACGLLIEARGTNSIDVSC